MNPLDRSNKDVMNTKSTGWGLIGASTIARQYMIDAIRAQPGTRWSPC
jgi:hypothetical protein